jgi:hypothetical protein
VIKTKKNRVASQQVIGCFNRVVVPNKTDGEDLSQETRLAATTIAKMQNKILFRKRNIRIIFTKYIGTSDINTEIPE